MTTCDMCGDYRSTLIKYSVRLVSEDFNRLVQSLDLCGRCRDRVASKMSECLRDCRVSTVRDAIKGLTPEQVQQVEAYIAQQEARREVPS